MGGGANKVRYVENVEMANERVRIWRSMAYRYAVL